MHDAPEEPGYDPHKVCFVCGYPLTAHSVFKVDQEAYLAVLEAWPTIVLVADNGLDALGQLPGRLPRGWFTVCERLLEAEADQEVAHAKARDRELAEQRRAARLNRAWEEGRIR